MKRKGISPLIAAVLLIAFTMAVASLFAQWAPQLIKSAQGDTKNQSEQIQRCSGVIVDIQSADDTQATIQQTSGDTAVGNLSVTWFYESSSPAQNYGAINSNRGVVQVSSGTTGTLDQVRVNPVNCEGAPVATYP